MKTNTTFEKWKAEAHKLRTQTVMAEGSFFLHLLAGEELFEKEDLGMTYDEFLVSETLVKAERWRAFREATKVIAAEKVGTMGFTAFVELARRSTPEKRQAYEENVLAFSRQHGHPPSDERAREIARIVDPPPPRDTRTLTREMSIEKLKAENAALRRENDRLRKRVAELEAKNAPAKKRKHG